MSCRQMVLQCAAVLSLACSPLFAIAAEPDARISTTAAVKNSVPPEQIDALLDATAFPMLYDRLLGKFREPPQVKDEAMAAVWRQLLDLMPWRITQAKWRAFFADRLDAKQVADVVAYYRSPSGRAMTDCLAHTEGRISETECLDTVSASDRAGYLDFSGTPSGAAWIDLGEVAVRAVTIQTACDGLDRDMALRRRLAAACAGGSTMVFCRMLVPAAAGGDPTLDPAMCPVGALVDATDARQLKP